MRPPSSDGTAAASKMLPLNDWEVTNWHPEFEKRYGAAIKELQEVVDLAFSSLTSDESWCVFDLTFALTCFGVLCGCTLSHLLLGLISPLATGTRFGSQRWALLTTRRRRGFSWTCNVQPSWPRSSNSRTFVFMSASSRHLLKARAGPRPRHSIMFLALPQRLRCSLAAIWKRKGQALFWTTRSLRQIARFSASWRPVWTVFGKTTRPGTHCAPAHCTLLLKVRQLACHLSLRTMWH